MTCAARQIGRASEAGCTPQEIATITGHSLRDVGAILDRYSARTTKLAVAAIAKLERARTANESATPMQNEMQNAPGRKG